MTPHSGHRVEHLLRSWDFSHDQPETAAKDTTIWKRLANTWLRFARVLGKANAYFLLTVVYLLVLGPGAIVLKLLRKDLLDRRFEDRTSYWQDKATVSQDIEQSKHQF
jgi:hypothetical protein